MPVSLKGDAAGSALSSVHGRGSARRFSGSRTVRLAGVRAGTHSVDAVRDLESRWGTAGKSKLVGVGAVIGGGDDRVTTAKDTWPIKNFPQGYAWSGGELAAKYPSSFTGLEMHARMTPHVQLQIGDGSWHDWTPATMSQFGDTTTDCQDSPYTMQWWVYFEDFLSSGTAP